MIEDNVAPASSTIGYLIYIIKWKQVVVVSL